MGNVVALKDQVDNAEKPFAQNETLWRLLALQDRNGSGSKKFPYRGQYYQSRI